MSKNQQLSKNVDIISIKVNTASQICEADWIITY